MTDERYSKLDMLGSDARAADTPEEARLERVENPTQTADYMIRFACPEFTSIFMANARSGRQTSGGRTDQSPIRIRSGHG